MSTISDRAALAAMAQGWIEEEAPALFQDGLSRRVEQWRGGAMPLVALWLPLIDRLTQAGAWDAELSACRLVASLLPNDPTMALRLGRVLLRLGEAEEAVRVLSAIIAPDAARLEAMTALAKAGHLSPRMLDGFQALLAETPNWGEGHKTLMRQLAEGEAPERAKAFLHQWTDRWEVPAQTLMDLAQMAFLVGDPAKARALFGHIWAMWRPGGGDLGEGLGGMVGPVPPYGEATEAVIQAAIDAAFAMPETELACVPLPEHPPAASVMMVTFEDRHLVNDLAAHFSAAARLAGVPFTLYADSAVSLPLDFIGSDTAVAERLDRLEEAVIREKPDVLLVDCASPLSLRGLNPARLWEIKARSGCRTVGLIRDSHQYAMPLLRAWEPALDTLVADIASPAFSPDDPLSQTGKLVPLVVPALHGPFLERCPPKRDLAFIGAVNFVPRAALLSVLMTEDIVFEAVTGAARRVRAPDMAAYARVLGEARAVLNVSAHGLDDFLVTGRVWETIARGTALVEQDNAATRRFLTPWRHYLPWRNAGDVVHLAHFIARRPDQAARVADAAHDWSRRHYAPARVWAAILENALRPFSAGLDADAETAARRWHEVSFG